MEYLVPIVIIIVLILLNGLFVAAEFAIIGAPRAAIEHRAAGGDRAAKLVHKMLNNPRLQDSFIAASQLGITLASLGLGMYGEHQLAHWIEEWLEGLGELKWVAAHTVASVAAIAILTYFHIVIGEMVPKSMALMHAERTVLWIIRPLHWFKMLLYPLVIGLNSIGNGILRLMGIRREMTSSHYLTNEELQFVVQESQEGGLLRAESGKVLRELFAFGELDAGEIMVPRVHIAGIPLDAGTETIAALLCEEQHTRYPVYEGDLDHIIGVIHIKDLLCLLTEKRPLTRDDVRPTEYIPETTELESVLEAMRRKRTQMVIVMDEHGGTAGIISMEDLCDEVVGGVEEGVEDKPQLYRDAEGRLHAAGLVRLDEVGESLELELKHEEVDTVSGLILAELERPPVVGDTVTYQGAIFEVCEVEGHGVAECLVSLAETPESEESASPE